jgi:hypothetical protein
MGGMRVAAVLCGLCTIAVMGSCAPGSIAGMQPNFLTCQQRPTATATGTMVANSELRLQVEPGHVLLIPAGGAEAGTVFTMTARAGTMIRVNLSPSGQLRAPATLTLSHENCAEAGNPADYRVWRQGRPGSVEPGWRRVGGMPMVGQRNVSVSLDSLSTYSLAAN